MNFLKNAKAFLKMFTPLSIFMFWAILLSSQTLPQASLLKDIQTGAASSSPRQFVTLGNKAFFLANSESDINQPPRLMVTDGTDVGTSVAPFVPLSFSSISAPAIFNGQLFYGLNQGGIVTLWRSADGVNASVVDTVWKQTGQGTVRFYEDYLYVKNNQLYIKISHDVSLYNADFLVDLFRSNGQSNGLVKVGLAETKYYNAESTSSEVFSATNVDYFITSYNAFSNGYMGVRLTIGSNNSILDYRWSSMSQPSTPIQGLGVLNNDLIFLNGDTLSRINVQGQRQVLLTGVKYGAKLAQINNFIYLSSEKGIYRTDGTIAGTLMIANSSLPVSDTKPQLSNDLCVIGDTLYVSGYTYDRFGIWQINSGMSSFSRILNIEAPKPYLMMMNLGKKIYLTENIGNKTTVYEPDFIKNKVKPLGQLDRWDYSNFKAKNTAAILNSTLITSSGDNDAISVTANAKGSELRKLSLTPSVSTFPCVNDTAPPSFYSCPSNLIYIKYNLSPNWCYFEPIPRPNTFDNCGEVVTGVSAIKGQFQPESQWQNGQPYYTYCVTGIDTVTYWVRDLSYNVSKCSFTITVTPPPNACDVDNIPPTFSKCPVDTLINSSQAIIVNWTTPAITDNCGIPSVSVNFPSGSSFPVGTTKVIYTATDAKNNSSTCSFNINIQSQTVSNNDLCANPAANVKGGPNTITIKGIKTASAIIQIFNSSWSSIYNQQIGSDSITVPNLVAGAYNVKVTVLETGGIWPAVCSVIVNVNVTDQVIQPLKKGDLIVTDFAPVGFSAQDYNKNLFVAYLKNIGDTTTTGQYEVKIFVSEDTILSSNDSLLAIGTSSGIPFLPNSAQNISLSMNNFAPKTVFGKAYWLIAKVDTKNVIDESIENNNTLSKTASISYQNLKVDKVFLAKKSDFSSPIYANNTVNKGDSVTIFQYHNTLVGPSQEYPSVKYRIYFSKDTLYSADDYLIETQTKTIESFRPVPSGYYTTFFNTTALNNFTSGTFNIVVEYDFDNILSESNEKDNWGYIPINWVNNTIDPCLNDVIPPVISNCPSSINLTTTGTTAIATWTAPTATDNCTTTPSVSSNYSSGFAFPIGSTNVVYTAKDIKNNAATCGFSINVTSSTNPCDTDTQAPVLNNCPTNINLTTTGTTAIATWTAPTATDNCTTTPSVSSNYNSGFAFPIGTTNVVYTAKDVKNNASTCSFNVIVTLQVTGQDVCTNPTANVKGGASSIIISGITTSSAIVQIFNVTWSSVYNQQVSSSSVTIPNLTAGNYQVKVTVLGAGGRWPSHCEVLVNNVVVTAGNPCDNDIIAPTFSNCPSNINLTITGTTGVATWVAPTATDNCTTTPSVSSNYNSGFAFPVGTTNVIHTAKDAKNNTSTCRFNVIVAKQLDGITIKYSSHTLKINEKVCVSVSADSFFNIVSAQWTNTFNPAVLRFDSVINFTALGSRIVDFGVSARSTGFVDFTFVGLNRSVPNGTKLYDLCFTAIGQPGSTTLLKQEDVPRFISEIYKDPTTLAVLKTSPGTVTIEGTAINTPDVALSITSNPTTYRQWTTNTFRISAKNNGTQAMSNIKIQFQYPDKTVKGGDVIPSVGTWNEYCSGGILCYEWTIPTLAPNATATLDVPLFVLGATAPIIATTKLLTSTPADGNASNNTATVTVSPTPAASQMLQAINRTKPTQYIPIVIQTVAPNPTEGDVLIEIESIVEKEVRFDFYNTLGKIIKSETRVVKKGENYLQFDFWNAQNGIYFIQTSEGQGRGVPLKFVKM